MMNLMLPMEKLVMVILGVTILNGLEEINNNKANFKDDMGANFMLCSQAFVKKSGSSFGTLIAFSFMNISRNLKR